MISRLRNLSQCGGSERFDADPDPTFHADADPNFLARKRKNYEDGDEEQGIRGIDGGLSEEG